MKIEIARVSNEGLCVTALLVAVLWGLVLANHRILHRAEADASQAFLQLRSLRPENEAGPRKSHERPAYRRVTATPRASSIPI